MQAGDGLRMVVTDLDGTLLGPQGRVSSDDLATLHSLGRAGVVRVVATGRSLYSVKRVLEPAFPIDYLVFSSGAGVMDWRTRELLRACTLGAGQATAIAGYLRRSRIDFMLHRPIPDNHRFFYEAAGGGVADFRARLALYRDFAAPLPAQGSACGAACQFVAITENSPATYGRIRDHFSDHSVIRATSPLDARSLWIEIFARCVSKSQAAGWLCTRLGLGPQAVLALGNDYNDLDLLEWAGSAMVVANAPAELREAFEVTASNGESGFAHAVRSLLDSSPSRC